MASLFHQDPGPPPEAAEIAELLDQCSPRELASILDTIERGEKEAHGVFVQEESPTVAAPPSTMTPALATPVPPVAPPPQGGRGGRPNPLGNRRPVVAEGNGEGAVETGAGAAAGGAAQPLSMAELQRMLSEHSADLVAEVKKLIPGAGDAKQLAPGAEASGTLDMNALALIVAERDKEVLALESHLADLQSELAAKDRRASELGAELDSTTREVRKKQLDLEFHQRRLEERVRSNAELEQVQRNLSARVEEAELSARHAAIDADGNSRSILTPRGIRPQGSIPWSLRKSYQPPPPPPPGAP